MKFAGPEGKKWEAFGMGMLDRHLSINGNDNHPTLLQIPEKSENL